MSKIRLGDVAMPLELVTESVGILAVKRAGKSHTAKKLAEQLHKAGQQIVVVDPKGDWWGLRSSADGKGPGLPLPILGGEHGDIPLEPGAGELVAKLVVEQRVSLVLDLSDFRKYQIATFMTAFLETVYRLKAKDQYRTPMMLVIDEADAIAPQRPMKGEERMLGAATDIVRRGGQRGIGITLVTQRSAALSKEVLTQVGVLILLRTTGSQDIDAIDRWIEKHGQPAERDQVLASIASMPRGTAWVWAPGWPTESGIFQQVKVGPITTFDSGATPKPGERQVKPKTLADVDIKAFQVEMSATIERAKAEDPKELRKEIARLKAEVAKKAPPAPAPKAAAPVVQKKEVPVLKDAQLARLEKVVEKLGQFGERTVQIGETVVAVGREITAHLAKLHQNGNGHGRHALPPPVPVSAPQSRAKINYTPPARERPAPVEGEFQPTKSRTKILDALAFLEQIGITRADKTQLALLADCSPTSGGYFNNLGALRSAALIDYPGPSLVSLTEKGRALADPGEAPQTTEQLQRVLFAKLTGSQVKILEALIEAYPNEITKDQLAQLAGQSSTSGGYFNNLGRLRSLGLIDYPGAGRVVALPVLFLEGV